MDPSEVKRALCQLDASSHFLLLIIASVLLSFQTLRLQRRQACRLLSGEEADTASLFPLRLLSSALIIGALGFFLSLSLDALKQTEATGSPGQRRSAMENAVASVLVLAAALLRLDDLLATAESEKGNTASQPPA